jgi:hypothetical protein
MNYLPRKPRNPVQLLSVKDVLKKQGRCRLSLGANAYAGAKDCFAHERIQYYLFVTILCRRIQEEFGNR